MLSGLPRLAPMIPKRDFGDTRRLKDAEPCRSQPGRVGLSFTLRSGEVRHRRLHAVVGDRIAGCDNSGVGLDRSAAPEIELRPNGPSPRNWDAWPFNCWNIQEAGNDP